MDAENHSHLTRSWRRCADCGRYFSFPGWTRTPRECAGCGSHALVRSSPSLSFWRLLSD